MLKEAKPDLQYHYFTVTFFIPYLFFLSLHVNIRAVDPHSFYADPDLDPDPAVFLKNKENMQMQCWLKNPKQTKPNLKLHYPVLHQLQV